MNGSFRKFMTEQKLVNRWLILISAIVGAFFGAILMFLFALLGLLS